MTSDYWQNFHTRRASRRRVLAASGAATAGLAALAIVGCGDDSPANGGGTGASPATTTVAQPKRGGVYRQALDQLQPNMDVHKTNAGAGFWDWVGNYLVRFSVDSPGALDPDLAAALPEQPDELTYVFKINPGATWQQRAPTKGRKVTSEDVKFSFEDVLDKATASPRAGNYSQVASIEAPDPSTVIFKMKVPKPDLLATMADQYDFIYPAEWKVNRPKLTVDASEVVGTGPYELVSFSSDQGFKVERRKDAYWKPNQAWFDSAEYPLLPDPDAQLAGLRSGQFTVVIDNGKGFMSDRKSELVQAGYFVDSTTTPSRNLTIVNHGVAPFDDPRVRLAMSRAINRRLVYANGFAGQGAIGGAISPAMSDYVLPEQELVQLPGYLLDADKDFQEARKLMDSAGVKDIKVQYETKPGSIASADAVLVPMYRKLGVNPELRDWGITGSTAISNNYAKGDFTLGGFQPIAGPYPDAQLIIYHASDRTAGSRNYGNYKNDQVDALLTKQSREFKKEARVQIVREIQKLVAQSPGPLWIGSPQILTARTKALQGWKPTNLSTYYQLSSTCWLA